MLMPFSPVHILASGIALQQFYNVVNAQGSSSILTAVPAQYVNVSAVLIRDNLAVIPADWISPNLTTPFYDIQTNDSALARDLATVKAADFIAFDASFFDVIGTDATVEKLIAFPGVAHVHEAPVYLPETNELLFSDTSALGWLWAIEVDTLTTRNITTNPPLWDVNGGTIRNGQIYLTTNGNSARGLWTFNATDGSATAVVNNYRGRHLNSPNDVVIDSNSNLWFTDPAYGWYSAWPGVSAPELPNSIYFFNTTSKALISLSNSVALVPNGLALSEDESILYVTDSNSTSGQPTQNYAASQRNVWAFDIDGVMLSNPRLVYEVESGWPDGLRVTRNGLLIIAVLGGADVIDPHTGILLGRINAVDDIIFNVESVPGTGTWFMTGQNFIYKFTIKEKSLVFK